MRLVGYAHLHQRLALMGFEPHLPARVAPVLRVIAGQNAAYLAIPENMAPAVDADVLTHVLFALKHEGTDLQILAQVLPFIPAVDMQNAIFGTPGGVYIRKACYLYEHFMKMKLNLGKRVVGAVAGLFDAKDYVTADGAVHLVWRIQFNGLGTLDYCPVVRRTGVVQQLLEQDVLKQLDDFVANADKSILDRAISWAYLSETEGTFSIENETPTPSKKDKFVQILQRAHDKQAITEEYLVQLQNLTIDNPWDKAAEFRNDQNRLKNGRLVTYVPPAPELSTALMGEFMAMANSAPMRKVDPVVAAALSSFGLVFIHPFMDGNGRISRFLFHKALCDSGRLPHGALLPVSVAMKKHERDYLEALKSFSAPARQLWTVADFGDGHYGETFNGSEAIYRYWDATPCVEFGLRMAHEALEQHLVLEVQTLQLYDHIKASVDEEFDVRSDHLSLLIFNCIDNGGRVSKNLRKKLVHQIPGGLEDRIEQLVEAHRVAAELEDQPGEKS